MRNAAVTALKILVSAALIWFLFHRIALGPVLADLRRITPGYAALAAVIGVAQIFLFAARWMQVGNLCGASLPWNVNLRLIFIGLFFNQALPSSVGGDAVRVWLSVRCGVPTGRAFSSVAVDRFVALIVLLGLSLVTLPLFYTLVGDATLRRSLTSLLIIAACGFGLLLAGGSRLASLLQLQRVSRPVGSVIADLRQVFLRPAGLGPVGLALAIHLASVASVYLLAAALAVPLSPIAALVLVPQVLLILVIPVTIAGWGLREAAMVVALGQINIAAPDALAISILFGLLQVAISLPGAILWLRHNQHAPAKAPAFNHDSDR